MKHGCMGERSHVHALERENLGGNIQDHVALKLFAGSGMSFPIAGPDMAMAIYL